MANQPSTDIAANPVDTTEQQRTSIKISQLVFSIFVYISDAGRDITIQEVRRFQSLLNDASWFNNQDISRAILILKTHYATFWTYYEDGSLVVDVASIAEGIGLVCRDLGAARSRILQQNIYRFVQLLDVRSYGNLLSRGNQRARSTARKEVLAILRMDAEQLANIRRIRAPKPVDKEPAKVPHGAQNRAVSVNSPADVQTWAGGRTKVRCVSVVSETHDTKTYGFVADEQTLFHYKPGQFLTLEVPLAGGQILRRSYTISSSPSRPYMLTITVKKVSKGWMSNWLFDNMVEGFECAVNGPTGNFTCADLPAEKLLLIGAGSGITPVMSMLRWHSDMASNADIIFINNVRTPDDIIFHQELLHLSAQLGHRLRLAIVPSKRAVGKPWHGPIGRFDESLLRVHAPDFAEREVFVCGPPAYLDAVKSVLASVEFPMDHFHSESFGASATPRPAAPAAKQAAPAAARAPAPSKPASGATTEPAQGAKIVIQSSGDSFVAQPGQTILEAADASGVTLNHSCRAGVCGACKMRTVSGQVEMASQTALSDDDIQNGYILTCISSVTGNVTIS